MQIRTQATVSDTLPCLVCLSLSLPPTLRYFSSYFLWLYQISSPVFVRRGQKGGAELVLLDHGLYDSLKEKDRINLCHLYKAIINKDEESMQKYSHNLGVKGQHAAILSPSILHQLDYCLAFFVEDFNVLSYCYCQSPVIWLHVCQELSGWLLPSGFVTTAKCFSFPLWMAVDNVSFLRILRIIPWRPFGCYVIEENLAKIHVE